MADRTIQFREFGKTVTGDGIATSERTLFSTIFYDCEEQLSEKSFFINGALANTQYQNASFPLGTSAFRVFGLRLTHNLQIISDNAGVAAERQQYFEEFSRITFAYMKRNGRLDFTLSDLVPWTQSIDAVDANNIGQFGKLATYYKLRQPLDVGASQNLEVSFEPARGLQTVAYNGTTQNVALLPGSGLNNGEQGFMMKLSLMVQAFDEIA